MRLNKAQLAVLALITANIIWGAAPPIFKWALADIHPYTLAFLRFAIPPLLMYPFVRHHLKINKKDYLNVLFAGIFGITINIAFFFHGLIHAPSINAALIAGSAPIFIIFYSLLFLKEKPRNKLIIGSLTGLLGVLVVLIVPLFKSWSFVAEGNLSYLIGMLGSVIGMLINRKILRRNSPMALTFWTFCVGGITFAPFFVQEVATFGFLQQVSIQGIIGIVFGVLLSSLAAYFLQNWALKYLTAADVSVFAYIDPVVTIVVAAPLLHEFPNEVFVIGSFLVLGGILLAEGRLHYHPFQLFLKP